MEDDGLKATVLTEHPRADEHPDCRQTGPNRANVGHQRRRHKADDQLSCGPGTNQRPVKLDLYPTICNTAGGSGQCVPRAH
jgi:hypothetical protein